MNQSLIWMSLGEVDFTFLEFLSLGNNFFFVWLMFIWFCFFVSSDFFYSFFILNHFKFCVIFFFNFFGFSLKNFEFYEYFSVIFPFLGIFMSMSLNFLLLSLGNSETFSVDYILLFMGKQWSWDSFYIFFMSGVKFFFFITFVNFLDFYVFFNFNFLLIKSFYSQVYFSLLLDSFIKEESLWGFFVYSYDCEDIKDFSYEGVSTFVFIMKDCVGIYYVTSLDVMHSFCIPLLGIKMDAIPGFFSGGVLEMQGKGCIWGNYEFGCFEYCGLNHSSMYGGVCVMDFFYFLYFI